MVNIPDPGDGEVVPVVDLAGKVCGGPLPHFQELLSVRAEERFTNPEEVLETGLGVTCLGWTRVWCNFI